MTRITLDSAAMRARYEAGATIEKIALDWHVSTFTARRLLLEAGTVIRSRRPKQDPKPRKPGGRDPDARIASPTIARIFR